MPESRHNGEKKPRGWWWKIPLGLLIFLFVALAAVNLFIDPIAHHQINRALDRFFTAGGRLEAIHIQLIKGHIDLDGLTINTPGGYGTDPLLSLGKLALDVGLASLLKGDVIVEQLTLKGVSFVLVRDKKGQLSMAKLIKPGKQASSPEARRDFGILSGSDLTRQFCIQHKTSLYIMGLRRSANHFLRCCVGAKTESSESTGYRSKL